MVLAFRTRATPCYLQGLDLYGFTGYHKDVRVPYLTTTAAL